MKTGGGYKVFLLFCCEKTAIYISQNVLKMCAVEGYLQAISQAQK
jgi:hypothetical protein